MKPDVRFQRMPKHFWANVRTISQHIGYTVKGAKEIRVPTIAEITHALKDLDLNTKHVVNDEGQLTDFGQLLSERT